MAFAIEVPGEANPLNAQQLYFALQSAGSSQPVQIQTGTKQLQNWESQRGYYPLLQAVYLDNSLPTEIRYLAILQLKNGIDRYWRKTATNAITPEEKAGIRSHLLEGGLCETQSSLALQNALVVSKVLRIDYPLEWSDVLPNLISNIRSANDSNQLHLRRGILMLHQVVKELATARLARSQTSLKSITPEMVYLLSEIYLQKVTVWSAFIEGSGEDEEGALEAMENSLFATKILRRLLVAGYESPNQSTDVKQLWQRSQHHFGQFLALVSQDPVVLVSPARDLVEKHLIQLSKLHVEMANIHPAAFALLPNSIELARAYWNLVSRFGDSYGSATHDLNSKVLSHDNYSDRNERPAMERLCVKGLTLVRACLRMVHNPTHTFRFRTPEVKAEQKQAQEFFQTQLLTNEFVTEVASVIVTKFFVFRQVDLESWEEKEDEWEGTASDTWEFEVRPCSERLFCDLVTHYKHLLVEPLLQFFQSVAGTQETSLVKKDAVYTAMGLSAPVVHDHFDFDAFLTSTLVNDVSQVGPACKVIKRRVAILVAQWVTIRISDANRPLVYQIFSHLLRAEDKTNDIVVRLTAARNFKTVVDDIAFHTDALLPFAREMITQLMSLVQEVENTEAKMAILETIRSIASRIGQKISPFADQIVSLLPALWEASGEVHLLKQAILTLMSTITSAMRQESSRYHPLILPLIRRAVEQGSDMRVYLLEEELDLWSVVLAQTAAPASPEIATLIECTFPLLEIGSDSLRVVLNIVHSYVLLAPDVVLGDAVRVHILSHMTNLLGVSKRELAGLVITIVEDIIRAASSLGGTNGLTIIANDLHQHGYISKVFAGLKDAWEAHEIVGPDHRYPKLDDVVETDYFTVLARISLADPGVFWSLLTTIGEAKEVWGWLSKEWFRHFDCMANIDRQKLSCLAITRLLELPSPVIPLVLERLQDYFAMWTAVINEIMSGRDDGGDNLIWGPSEGNEFEEPEDVRKRQHAAADEVHTTHTFEFVKEKLRGLVAICGGEEAFQQTWVVNVDSDVLAGFQELGTVKPYE